MSHFYESLHPDDTPPAHHGEWDGEEREIDTDGEGEDDDDDNSTRI